MKWTAGCSHLGDAIWAVMAMRKIPDSHEFYCNPEYHWQLAELCEGTQITLHNESDTPPDLVNTWIAAGSFMQSHGFSWDQRDDVIGFLTLHGSAMANRCGHDIKVQRKDFLFDLPAIQRPVSCPPFDVLVVNCPPRSGQVPRWDQGEMDVLISELGAKHRVLVTNPTTATNVTYWTSSVCGIGNLATRAKMIIAVASGASWGCWNPWTASIPKYVFLEPIQLKFSEEEDFKIIHHGLVDGMRQQLISDGWL